VNDLNLCLEAKNAPNLISAGTLPRPELTAFPQTIEETYVWP